MVVYVCNCHLKMFHNSSLWTVDGRQIALLNDDQVLTKMKRVLLRHELDTKIDYLTEKVVSSTSTVCYQRLKRQEEDVASKQHIIEQHMSEERTVNRVINHR